MLSHKLLKKNNKKVMLLRKLSYSPKTITIILFSPLSPHLSSVPLLMCFHLAISLGTVTRIWPFLNCIALLLPLPATLCVRFESSVCAIAFAMKSKIELNK